MFKANGGKVHPRLRFAIARESDEAVGSVRKFLGPGHLKDKGGPLAIRLTIVDITEAKKYQWRDGVPGELTVSDAQEFVQGFLAGKLAGVPARA